jgi:hypothetical protein
MCIAVVTIRSRITERNTERENMAKRRHLTPQEICAQCKAVARESRMAERSPWSAMAILCAYVIMKTEGFKGQRISKIANKVNEIEAQWSDGKIDLAAVSKRLYDKADWTVEYKEYTEEEITAKKGSYRYWIDSRQLGPQNTINEIAVRYMLFFFTTLMDEYGFGKERLTRSEEYMHKLLEDYQQDKTTVHQWKKALFDDAGIVMEMPIDPLTQREGSVMTGV